MFLRVVKTFKALVVGSRLRLTSAVCRFVSLTTTRSSVGVVAH